MVRETALIRPIRMADLDAVLALTRRGGAGLTNFPPDRDAMERRIGSAIQAIEHQQARNDGAPVILVAEIAGCVVATGMIFAQVGSEWPFYSYRITRQAAVSRALARSKAQKLLNLVNDLDGATEVGGLFVDPDRRGMALGQFMARSRYLFIAAHRGWFGDRVFAELRGYQNASGRSPVWDAIGRHFYDMEFDEADVTGAIHGNQFIADLGPRYPIYISMLPADAQACLGRPHDDGRPAHAMLLTEGFRDEGYVDIFDGGPTLVARLDDVRTIASSRAATYFGVQPGGVPALLAAGTGRDFRLAQGLITEEADGVRVDSDTASLLSISAGDTVRTVLMKAS